MMERVSGGSCIRNPCVEGPDIPAREVTSAERTVDIVQVKRFVRSILVKLKPGPQKTAEEARTAVNAVYRSLSVF